MQPGTRDRGAVTDVVMGSRRRLVVQAIGLSQHQDEPTRLRHGVTSILATAQANMENNFHGHRSPSRFDARNKCVRILNGGLVWCKSGRGRQRREALAHDFVVDATNLTASGAL